VKRILLLYITNLSGHYKAAKAIEGSLKILDKDCRVLSLDTLKYFHPFSSSVINFLYTLVIRKIPRLWGGMYDKGQVIKTLGPIKKFINSYNQRKVKRLMRELAPQAVICTQAFPCGLMEYNF